MYRLGSIERQFFLGLSNLCQFFFAKELAEIFSSLSLEFFLAKKN